MGRDLMLALHLVTSNNHDLCGVFSSVLVKESYLSFFPAIHRRLSGSFFFLSNSSCTGNPWVIHVLLLIHVLIDLG